MRVRKTLAWLWTIVILALCWYPKAYMGVDEERHGFAIPHLDKVIHLGIFAVFGFLWIWARAPSRSAVAGETSESGPIRPILLRRTLWILAAGLALAFVSEMGQELPVVNRDASLADGLADFAGVVVGLAGYALGVALVGRGKNAL